MARAQELESAGEDIIHLEIGEPDFDTSSNIREVGIDAIPGVNCCKPMGAIYAFPNIKSFQRSSEDIANLILEKANVALLPGTSFARYGEGCLRVVFANSLENIERAVQRIGDALSGLEL